MVQASVLALHMQPSVISIGDVTSYGTAAAAGTPERARVGVDPASGKPCIRCEGIETLARQHGLQNVLLRPDCRRVIVSTADAASGSRALPPPLPPPP